MSIYILNIQRFAGVLIFHEFANIEFGFDSQRTGRVGRDFAGVNVKSVLVVGVEGVTQPLVLQEGVVVKQLWLTLL